MENAPWSQDLLGRDKVAEVFERILKKSKNGRVILVDSGFGTGKTFFVDNWARSLEAKGHPVVCFDAWRNDYLDSPLVGFLNSFFEYAEAIKEPSERERVRRSLSTFARSAAPILFKGAVRIGVRSASLGFIDGDVDSIAELFVQEGGAVTEDFAQEVVQAFSRATSQREFHESLRVKFTETVEACNSKSTDMPLVVLIDEIDRCRPSFAIELLEEIKHFLVVPGVVFFLFCDEDVLRSQARMIFGDKTSGEKYLLKFYDLRLRLPTTGAPARFRVFFEPLKPHVSDSALDFLAALAAHYGASVRQTKLLTQFLEVVFSVNDRAGLVWPVYCFLASLRYLDENAYRQVSDERRLGEASFPKLAQDIYRNTRVVSSLRAIFCTSPDTDSHQLEGGADAEGQVSSEMLWNLGVQTSIKMGSLRKRLVGEIELAGSVVY